MEAYAFKLKFLFVPSLAVALGFIVFYLAAFGLLIEYFGQIHPGDEVENIILPLAAGAASAAIYVAPRLRVFEEAKSGSPEVLYFLAAAAMVAIPLMFLQPVLRETLWGLRSVDELSSIPPDENARYYAPQSICLDNPHTRWDGYVRAADRGNDIYFELYAAIPACDFSGHPDHWLGVHKTHRVDGSLSKEQRIAAADAFEQEVRAEVAALDPAGFSYVERVRGGPDEHHYRKAIAEAGAAGDAVIVEPRYQPFYGETKGRLLGAAISFAAAALIWALLLLFPKLNDLEADSVKATGKLTAKPDELSLRHLVIPSRFLFGPPLLIDAIVGVYLAMVLSGLGFTSFATADLLAWGADHGPLGFGPDHTGLVTAMFLHGGFMHMANNLYGLVFAVACLLPVARNTRLILSFLICGIAGSVASVLWNPQVVSVGASGAVLGLWGIAVALAVLRDRRIAGSERFILINVAIFGALTALMGALVPGIDNAAHAGGFVMGLILGVVLFIWEKIFPTPEEADPYQGLLHNLFKPTGKRAR